MRGEQSSTTPSPPGWPASPERIPHDRAGPTARLLPDSLTNASLVISTVRSTTRAAILDRWLADIIVKADQDRCRAEVQAWLAACWPRRSAHTSTATLADGTAKRRPSTAKFGGHAVRRPSSEWRTRWPESAHQISGVRVRIVALVSRGVPVESTHVTRAVDSVRRLIANSRGEPGSLVRAEWFPSGCSSRTTEHRVFWQVLDLGKSTPDAGPFDMLWSTSDQRRSF